MQADPRALVWRAHEARLNQRHDLALRQFHEETVGRYKHAAADQHALRLHQLHRVAVALGVDCEEEQADQHIDAMIERATALRRLEAA